MKTSYIIMLGIIYSILISSSISAQPFGTPGVQTAVTKDAPNNTSKLGYWEYLPTSFGVNSNEKFPLLIFLHGLGERGNGNLNDLNKISSKSSFPAGMIKEGTWLTNYCVNSDCAKTIVISPQSKGSFETDIIAFYNYIKENYPIDLNRVYITGISLGGGSVFKFLESAPDVAAAALPIAAGKNGFINNPRRAAKLRDLPIWSLVGYRDRVVSRFPTSNSMDSIADHTLSLESVYPRDESAIDGMNANDVSLLSNGTEWEAHIGEVIPPTHLWSTTFFSTKDHNTWNRTYRNEAVWSWLFSNIRNTKNTINTYSSARKKAVNLAKSNSTTIKTTVVTTDNTEAASFQWEEIGTNSSWLISTPNNSKTSLRNLTVGKGIFRLTGNHVNGNSDYVDTEVNVDSLTVIIDDVIEVSSDQENVSIEAIGQSKAGKSIIYKWTIEKNAPLVLSNKDNATVLITNLVEGNYDLKVRLTNSDGVTHSKNILLKVQPPNGNPDHGSWAEIEVLKNAPGKSISVYYDTNRSNGNQYDFGYPSNSSLRFAYKKIDESINIERLQIQVTLRYQTRSIFAFSSYIVSEEDDWTYYEIPLSDFGFSSTKLVQGNTVSKVSIKAKFGIGTGKFGIDEISFVNGDTPFIWYGEANDLQFGEATNIVTSDNSEFRITGTIDNGGALEVINTNSINRFTEIDESLIHDELLNKNLSYVKAYRLDGSLAYTLKKESGSLSLTGLPPGFYILRFFSEEGYLSTKKYLIR